MVERRSLFGLDEWRREILPRTVKECRIELLKQGKLGKRGLRVNRQALLACVKQKIQKIKQERLQQILSSL